MVLLLVSAIFAPLLAPHDPGQLNKRDREVAPFTTSKFLLGTDKSGKDILSRIIYGARTSVFISLVALGTGAIVGTAIGIVSGYYGGRLDVGLMRLVDAVLGFPTVLLALIIVSIVGGAGVGNVIIAVAATVWARFARQARGEVLSIKERDFVTLAHIAGVSAPVIMWRHIFPNVINTVQIVAACWSAKPSCWRRPSVSWGLACRRATRLGRYGVGGARPDFRNLVARPVPRPGHHHRGDVNELLWRLAPRLSRPQVETGGLTYGNVY